VCADITGKKISGRAIKAIQTGPLITLKYSIFITNKNMRTIPLVPLIFTFIIIIACGRNQIPAGNDIVIENENVRLVISADGYARNLIYKPANEELLENGRKIPLCTVTQERPYQNEVKLAYPTKETTFRASSIRKEGDKLIVGFELIPWEAVVAFRITPDYISFRIEDYRLTVKDYGIAMDEPAFSDTWFLQLPVRNRARWGDWLNVIWDEKLAVNLLATDPWARIDSDEEDGFRILKAGTQEKVRSKGTGTALIVSPPDKLLDNISAVENDFDLPHGVKSRKSDLYNASYYWAYDANPGNIDEHIRYAKMAGFRAFMIYYTAFTDGWDYRKLGNYDWKKESYPAGKKDLEAMLKKIRDAGMIPGFHFLHSHIGRESRYITPVPDHRLNLLKMFTLASPLSLNDTTIIVEENPEGITMTNDRRVLKIGTELISYSGYTTTRPFKFTGCRRGIDHTTVNACPAGFIFGLLDVSEFGATSVYINQNNDLQEEIADKLADIYSAGFRFCYFDGSEGVNPPFWFNVSYAQWKVFSRLRPEPLFAEGAAKTHFSWHMLTRGNAFDIFKPEELKESVRKFPADEAPRMENNFTHINFGWLGYWLPDSSTIGTQPDQLEYVTSRAAAWDCPISIMSNLKLFTIHPRTPDNMEVLRRWEKVRADHWLTEDQKKMLRNLQQEHILLINEKDQPELQPYEQITQVAGGSREIRAFIFRRNNDLYVVYWHISGEKKLELPVKPGDIKLLQEIGKEIPLISDAGNRIVIPAGGRRYLMTSSLTKDELVKAFGDARIIE
jgi:hypothetical protein